MASKVTGDRSRLQRGWPVRRRDPITNLIGYHYLALSKDATDRRECYRLTG
jgi:hypothetical protein